MKKILSVLVLGVFVLVAAPSAVVFADDHEYSENVLDKMSDWAKTVGKDENEKQRILTERKAARKKKHMEKKAEKMKKEAGKKAEKMKKDADGKAKDMKKKMGM